MFLRLTLAALLLSFAATLPLAAAEPVQHPIGPQLPSSSPDLSSFASPFRLDQDQNQVLTPPSSAPAAAQTTSKPRPAPGTPVDKNGDPIPLERQEPQRILGFMPNFRTVSGGAAAHPPGFRYNFTVATHQAFDYSSFIFLGLTSLSAEALNEHTALGKGIEGFGQYTWRGFLDKTDNTYLSAWFLPTLLREDTRYYALGAGHSMYVRPLYTISQQAVARTYSGHLTPNFAGLGGKVITQYVSRYYYPPSAATFGVLATKFGYSVMRDIAFSSVREFYPDIAAHYVHKHQEKEARLAAKRSVSQPVTPAPGPTVPTK